MISPISISRLEYAPWDYNAETLTQLNAVLGELGGKPDRATAEDMGVLLQSPFSAMLVARDEHDLSPDTRRGRIVGTTVVNVIPLPDGREARFDDVAVLNAYRRQGIARKLMVRAIGFARERGAADGELTTREERIAAGQLYESMGFVRRSTRVYTIDLTKVPAIA